MAENNILQFTQISQLRTWLSQNHDIESECWLAVKKGKVPPVNQIWYLDAVEQVLCFGWIDTIHKRVDGVNLQKFTPRAPRSNWSELNKERCRRLEKLGQMTAAGRAVLPDLAPDNFQIDPEIMTAFKQQPEAWQNFQHFPQLYQRVRIDAIQRDKRKDRVVFDKRLTKLIKQSAQNHQFGDWNDYGRLLAY